MLIIRPQKYESEHLNQKVSMTDLATNINKNFFKNKYLIKVIKYNRQALVAQLHLFELDTIIRRLKAMHKWSRK